MSAHVLTDEEAQEYIDLGTKAVELVRLGFPDADDELADYLLWEKTPFPVVRGVHDIVDHIALLVIEGPRCTLTDTLHGYLWLFPVALVVVAVVAAALVMTGGRR